MCEEGADGRLLRVDHTLRAALCRSVERPLNMSRQLKALNSPGNAHEAHLYFYCG